MDSRIGSAEGVLMLGTPPTPVDLGPRRVRGPLARSCASIQLEPFDRRQHV